MKKDSGITLMSLMVYIIALSILVGLTATFSKNMYKNTDNTAVSVNGSQNYTRVISYLTEDANSGLINNVDADNESLLLTLKDQTKHQYFYDRLNKKIYFIDWSETSNKNALIKLCDDVEACEFTRTETNSRKINVKIKINDIVYNNLFIIN